MAAHHWERGAGDVDRAEEGGLDLRPELLRAQLLEEAGVEVARVVNQHVDPAEPVDRSRHSRLGVGGIGDIQLDRQQVVLLSDRSTDLPGVPSGGDDLVTSGQRSLGDVDAQTAAGAGDQPNFLSLMLTARPLLKSVDLPGRSHRRTASLYHLDNH